jgi:hypothetical protein
MEWKHNLINHIKTLAIGHNEPLFYEIIYNIEINNYVDDNNEIFVKTKDMSSKTNTMRQLICYFNKTLNV